MQLEWHCSPSEKISVRQLDQGELVLLLLLALTAAFDMIDYDLLTSVGIRGLSRFSMVGDRGLCSERVHP